MSNSVFNSEWATLTHLVRKATPDPFFFGATLGKKGAITSPTTTCEFDVVSGRRDLAPMGHPGDPATRVDYSEGFETFTVTPPQIFLEDPIKANVLGALRLPGTSPYLTGSGAQTELSDAFLEHVLIKQRNMMKAIERRKEWLWAQAATTGKIAYTGSNGRKFSIDYGVSTSTNIFTSTGKWDGDDQIDPIFHLRELCRTYVEQNGFLPSVIVLGKDAADAFRVNKHVAGWLKSAGAQLLQLNMGQNDNLVTPVANIPGIGTIVEHIGTYPADNTGTLTPYMPTKAVLLTSPDVWQMHYGAIHDFDINPEYPLLQSEYFSKMKIAHDGKSKSLFVETHPLPVLEINTGIMVVTVLS